MAKKKTHRARWRDSTGRQRERRFATATEAHDWERRQKVMVSDGVTIDHERRRIPVHTWVADYIGRQQHLGDLTVQRYEGVVRNQITAERIGGTALGALRPSDVELWCVQLATRQGLAPRSVKKALDLLSASLNAAVRDGILTGNPADGVKPPKAEKAEMLWLTPQEVDRVCDHVGWRADVVRFLAYTGLRWSEMTRLTVADVDVLRGRVNVRRKAKSDAGYRSVPIAIPIFELVVGRVEGRAAHEPVFTTPRGARLHNSNFRTAFKRALEQAGLDPDVRIHDLRHSCATWLIGNGADVATVSRWLGHANPSITLNTYAHVWPDNLDAAAAALDRAAGRGSPSGTVHRLDDHRKEA